MNEIPVTHNGLCLEELEGQAIYELPPRELLATVNLSVLGIVNASATASVSASVLGLVNASVT